MHIYIYSIYPYTGVHRGETVRMQEHDASGVSGYLGQDGNGRIGSAGRLDSLYAKLHRKPNQSTLRNYCFFVHTTTASSFPRVCSKTPLPSGLRD